MFPTLGDGTPGHGDFCLVGSFQGLLEFKQGLHSPRPQSSAQALLGEDEGLLPRQHPSQTSRLTLALFLDSPVFTAAVCLGGKHLDLCPVCLVGTVGTLMLTERTLKFSRISNPQ